MTLRKGTRTNRDCIMLYEKRCSRVYHPNPRAPQQYNSASLSMQNVLWQSLVEIWSTHFFTVKVVHICTSTSAPARSWGGSMPSNLWSPGSLQGINKNSTHLELIYKTLRQNFRIHPTSPMPGEDYVSWHRRNRKSCLGCPVKCFHGKLHPLRWTQLKKSHKGFFARKICYDKLTTYPYLQGSVKCKLHV